MSKVATRTVAMLYATVSVAVGILALLGASAMIQAGPRIGPGDLAISMMPTTVLLGSCAIAQFKMTTLSGLALVLAILGFVTLAVVWIGHLGGRIYEVAGLTNLVLAICGLIYAYRVARRKVELQSGDRA
jgi:hypothetical protein